MTLLIPDFVERKSARVQFKSFLSLISGMKYINKDNVIVGCGCIGNFALCKDIACPHKAIVTPEIDAMCDRAAHIAVRRK